MAFDPDAYLMQKFDPDAFIQKRMPEPDVPFIDQAAGIGEVGLSMASALPAQIVGGVTGLGTAIATTPVEIARGFTGGEGLDAFSEGVSRAVGTGVDVSESVQEAMTYDPRTTEGKRNLEAIAGSEVIQAIGEGMSSLERTLMDMGVETQSGPLRTALAVAFPTAVLDLFSYKLPGAAAKIPRRVSRGADVEGRKILEEAEMLDQPTDVGMEEVSQVIQKGDPADIAQMVESDPNFYKALDDLDISVEPLASFGSQNPQFRSLESGLSAIPASALDAQQKVFIEALGKKADDLIEEYGGTLDKGELTTSFKTDSLDMVEDLNVQVDDVYNFLDEVIPKSSRVDASNTVALINQIERELGGKLPGNLKKLRNELSPKTTKGQLLDKDVVMGVRRAPDIIKKPTHELLNTRRRQIGAAINKRQGAFKDADVGQLKRLYGVLKQDQRAIADGMNIGGQLDLADDLVIRRKQLEDNLVKLLGKDLNKSLMPTIAGAMKGLEKGKIAEFNAVIDRIPKHMRQKVIVSSLNDIFKGTGAHAKDLGVTNFTKFMNEMNRQPALKKALYKNIPPEMRNALDSLAVVSRGVSRALQDKIPTGRVAAFFDNNQGFLRRMMGGPAESGAKALAYMKGGPMAASVVDEFLKQSTDGAKTAATILASPKFQSLIRDAVKEGVVAGGQKSAKLRKAEKVFEKSKKFLKWADALGSEKAALMSLGTVEFLLGETNQAESQ